MMLLLQLLLRAEHVGVPTLLLPAIHSPGVQPGVTLAADHFVTVVFPSEDRKRWLDDAASQAEDQVQRGLLLDVIVAQRTPILQLLAGEDEALLIWRYPFLVLDLGLHIVDGVRGLDIERDGLARERLHEDLHRWWLPRRAKGCGLVAERPVNQVVSSQLGPKWLE